MLRITVFLTVSVLLLALPASLHVNAMPYLKYQTALAKIVAHTVDYLEENNDTPLLEPRDTLGILSNRPTLTVPSVYRDCRVLDQEWKYWGTVADVIRPTEAFTHQPVLVRVVGDTYWVLVERANCWDHIERYVVSYRSTPETHDFYLYFDEPGTHTRTIQFVNSEGLLVTYDVTLEVKSPTKVIAK